MKSRKTLAAVGLAVLVAAGAARAGEDEGILSESNFSGSVAITTDYLFRGVSQTNSSFAVQGSLGYAHPVGVYLGVWASNVSFGGSIELDYYLGFQNTVGDFSYDLGVVYYAYPKSRDDPELDYLEGYIGVGYALPVALAPAVGAKYYYSPDFTGEDGAAHYVAGSLGVSLPWGLGFVFEVGYQTVAGDKTTGNNTGEDGGDGFDYVHYKVAASKTLLGFDLELAYHTSDVDSDHVVDEDLADSRFVFTVSRSL